MVLARDPLCRDPFKRGCTNASRIGDHIIPKAHGGTDALENLQGICTDCHNAKIHLEQQVKFTRDCACEIPMTARLIATNVIALACEAHAKPGSLPVASWTRMVA